MLISYLVFNSTKISKAESRWGEENGCSKYRESLQGRDWDHSVLSDFSTLIPTFLLQSLENSKLINM